MSSMKRRFIRNPLRVVVGKNKTKSATPKLVNHRPMGTPAARQKANEDDMSFRIDNLSPSKASTPVSRRVFTAPSASASQQPRPLGPKVLIKSYQSQGFLSPPITIDDSNLIDLSLEEYAMTSTSLQQNDSQSSPACTVVTPETTPGATVTPTITPATSATPTVTPAASASRRKRKRKASKKAKLATPTAKAATPTSQDATPTSQPKRKKHHNQTLEDGELRDDDSLQILSPPPPPTPASLLRGQATAVGAVASPDVVILGEIQRRRRRSDRFSKLSLVRGKKREEKKRRKRDEWERDRDRLREREHGKKRRDDESGRSERRGRNRSGPNRTPSTPPRQGTAATTTEAALTTATTTTTTTTTTHNGQTCDTRMPPPKLGTAATTTQHQQQARREPVVTFDPRLPPNFNFSAGVGTVPGSVYRFSGAQDRIVPTMGTRHLSHRQLPQPVPSMARSASASSLRGAGAGKANGMSNIFVMSPEKGREPRKRTGLRPIVIDGSNVAYAHGQARLGPGHSGRHYSSRGIDICVEYFKRRGHKEVKAFVPQHRFKNGQSTDRHLLEKLKRSGNLVETPSRSLQSHSYSSYDDRYVVQYAALSGGVIVSNDNFRDLLREDPTMTEAIEQRLLMFSWVNGDTLMFPQDPLGKDGPSLERFLTF